MTPEFVFRISGRVAIATLCVGALMAQKYSGPRPAKPDIPYLVHADSLVETEAVEAKEEKRKDDLAYIIPGANSSAKTPLAGPVFILQGDKLQPGIRNRLLTRRHGELRTPIQALQCLAFEIG